MYRTCSWAFGFYRCRKKVRGFVLSTRSNSESTLRSLKGAMLKLGATVESSRGIPAECPIPECREHFTLDELHHTESGSSVLTDLVSARYPQ